MVKRVSLVLLCVLVIVGISGFSSPNVTAKTNESALAPLVLEFVPFWQNAATITLDMSLSGGNLRSSGVVTGQAGTTGITANFTLERQNANGTFSQIDRWSANNGASPMVLSSSRSTASQTAGTYRISVTARVTRNGVTETVSGTHTMALR